MLSETGEKPFEGRLAFVLQDSRETHGASLCEPAEGVERGGVGNADGWDERLNNIG